MLQGPALLVPDKLWADEVMPALVRFQEQPDVALHVQTGLRGIGPHQRLMLIAAHRGAQENYNVSGRGTAKSATWLVLYALYHGIHFPKRKLVELAATGFRGGQLMFSDAEVLMNGGWDSQDPDVPFLKSSIMKGKSLVQRQPNWQKIEFGSFSEITTYPTTDADKILGIRGHMLFIDEANTFDPITLSKAIEPFANVQTDFEGGGARADKNAFYYTTTIDYAWREFQNGVRAAKAGITRDYEAYQAAKRGDWDRVDELGAKGLHEYSYTTIDYTDTIIPRYVTTRDGRTFEVKHPNPKFELVYDPKGIPFTVVGPDGRLQRDGEPIEYYKTYPINKEGIERKLLDGMTDEAIWLHEQRNVVDNATGDVYPHWLVAKVTGESGYHIPYEEMPEPWRQQYAFDQRGWTAPVMYTCNDPVVIGVDYAGGERDFSAFTIIRVGPMASGIWNPFTCEGKTAFSNVIWCEQYRQMSHKEVADKIRAFLVRYPNLAFNYDPVETDTWKLCRAIGLDMKGGGTGVRDALVYIDHPDAPPLGSRRILDPLDKDSRIQTYLKDTKSLPVLDAIMPSDQINDWCVEFTLAQMKVGKLFIASYLEGSERPYQKELDPGYAGVRTLAHQLRKIQQEPTKNFRRFFMPGDDERLDAKKDMFSSWLYAGKQLRANIIRQQMLDTTPPPMNARRTQINKNRGKSGRSPGARW